MSQQEQILEPVEVEVSTRQERERRRTQGERKQIEAGAEIGWRSYDRRNIPARWRV